MTSSPPYLWRVGPLYRLGEASGLFGADGLDVPRRSIAFLLVAWLPIVVLGLLDRVATGAWDPVLSSGPLHVRFVVCVPLLFTVERVVDLRVGMAMRHLREGGIVHPGIADLVADVEARATRACGAWWVEALLLAGGVALSFGNAHVTGIASVWALFVALPLFRWVLLRWVHRWLVWCWFLARLARLDLSMNGLNPDRAGGLGVLNEPSGGFGFAGGALGTVIAAELGRVMDPQQTLLEQFAPELLTYVGLCVALGLVPLIAFVPTLVRARRYIRRRFGVFSARYTRAFEAKWLNGRDADSLGSPDIQSLTDLDTSENIVRNMRIFPASRNLLIELVVVAALPVVPLYLESVSVPELAVALAGLLL